MTRSRSAVIKSTIVTLATLLISSAVLAGNVWVEDFETGGNGVRYTSTNEFLDSATDDDYFGRVRASDRQYFDGDAGSGFMININAVAYSGQSGEFYYAGEDLDDTGGTTGNPDGLAVKEIIFDDIDISFASGLTFRGLFAAGNTNPCASSAYDETDFIEVYYRVDGGVEILALCFNANIECNIPADISNEPLHHDPNCDGDGGEGVQLTQVFQEFMFMIPDGNSVDIRLQVHVNASDEEIAFDHFRIESPTVPVESMSWGRIKARFRN